MVPILFIICVLPGSIDAALRVFGGRDVDPQEYPYVVSIDIILETNEPDQSKIRLFPLCTASVLTPNWTLSAGHCLNFKALTSFIQTEMPTAKFKFVIQYGSSTAYRSSPSFSDIITSLRHPAYKVMEPYYDGEIKLYANDVGLLKTMPIKLSKYGKLSAVEYPSLVGQEAVALGYGLMHEGEKSGPTLSLGKPLQALDVLIKPCTKDLTQHSPIICLSRKCRQPVSSLCPGDSGGPVIHFSGVVGINHQAEHPDCLLQNVKAGISSNKVGTITPVSPYIEWIADIIRKNK